MSQETNSWNSTVQSVTYHYYTFKPENDTSASADYVETILFGYVAPGLIVLGTVGNLLSVVVLHSRFFNKARSSFTLGAMALADTGILYCSPLRFSILVLTGGSIDIRALSTASCRLHAFFAYFLPQLSSWSLVLATLERFASISWPDRAKLLVNKPRMASAWAVTFLSLALLNAHQFITQSLVAATSASNGTDVGTQATCSSVTAAYFADVVWPWMDLVVMSLLPATFIFVAEMAIALRHCRRRQRNTKDEGELSSVTAMVIGISVFFLLTSIPVSAYVIWLQYARPEEAGEPFFSGAAYSIANMIYYFRSSASFLVYCISDSKYRAALSPALSGRGKGLTGGDSGSKYSASGKKETA